MKPEKTDGAALLLPRTGIKINNLRANIVVAVNYHRESEYTIAATRVSLISA